MNETFDSALVVHHYFTCDNCGHERVWGATSVPAGGAYKEAQHPLLLCSWLECSEVNKHTPHTFSRYN